MAKVKGKSLPRRERGYPQTYRVFSRRFQEQMDESAIACWVPMVDVVELEQRYMRLFKRYQMSRSKL